MQPLLVALIAAPDMLKAIDSFVQDVEKEFPAGTPGEEKLEAVHQNLARWYATVDNAYLEFESIWPQLQAVVAHIVAAYNSAGFFKKTTA